MNFLVLQFIHRFDDQIKLHHHQSLSFYWAANSYKFIFTETFFFPFNSMKRCEKQQQQQQQQRQSPRNHDNETDDDPLT
ncbi:hypothetical protein DERF_010329 [Dermatophagoides farinae]|uniref:Uncharacterized protein n=1 Tax=Dermatophagoides farinae TaxID=6954 RepID=A0A922HWZ7_DERFA|nr:hypothetical protein DERF_010329 [Dermatophagoides farinae]